MDMSSSAGNQGGGNTASSSSSGSQGGGFGSGSTGEQGVGGSTGSSVTPSVIDLSDDSLVRVPGSKDPVKYGDYYRGFQSQFTKTHQEAAQLRAELQRHQDQIRQYQSQEQLRQRQQQSQSQAQPGNDLIGKLKSLSYLSGEEAANVVQHITQQIGQYDQALQQRDMALGLMYNKFQQMEQVVNQLQGAHTSGAFESKIDKFVSAVGLPPEAKDFAKELYMAYEGDDLDQEFPNILRNRWQQLQNLARAQEKREVQQARQNPFVPGRGGQGSASKPLTNLSRMSARDISEAVWPGLVDGSVET